MPDLSTHAVTKDRYEGKYYKSKNNYGNKLTMSLQIVIIYTKVLAVMLSAACYVVIHKCQKFNTRIKKGQIDNVSRCE